MSSYLRFQSMAPDMGFPVGSVAVLSARRGDVLGVISYYPPWREHILESAPDVVWSCGCLAEVQAKIVALNADRLAALVEPPVPPVRQPRRVHGGWSES